MISNFDKITDELINIRLGLPKNGVNEKIKKQQSINNDTYNHIASIIIGRKTFKVMTIGNNQFKTNTFSVHAEYEAIRRLPTKNNKSLQHIDIIVIRTSINRKLCNSKPCIKCLYDMYSYAPKKGYKICNVYYSNSQGEIVKDKLTNLIRSDNKHVTRYYRSKGIDSQWLCKEIKLI